EMDGFEATRRIRDASSSVANHDIPIIALTAHAIKGDREKCLKAGMDDYISKPVNPREVAEVIEKWLSQPAQPKPISPASERTEEGAVFDREALLGRLDGDEAFLDEILRTFMDSAREHIKQLSQAVENNDATNLQRQAHGLKGAAANIMANAIRDVASELEMAAREGNLSEARSLFSKIEVEFRRLKEMMDTQHAPEGAAG
ncbi:MAG: Hpt domain-containing protein, partial [bacterium]